MLKLLGAILIVAGTAAFGVGTVARLRSRVRCLTAISSSLEIMKNEICDRLTPVPELINIMVHEAPKPAVPLFRRLKEKLPEVGRRPFYEIWRQALEECKELPLSEAEIFTLTELGLSIGRYDAGEQRTAFEYAQRRMEEFAKKARNECETNSKANAFLGVASGIFAVIILL
jgi:stage III sporulation protein AB